MKPTLEIFSGEVNLGLCGIPTDHKDCNGVDMHTGDIVTYWHGEHIGSDIEGWYGGDSLTAVVTDDDGKAFVMGLKDCRFTSPEWRIKVVKKFSDVVSGEHWKDFGFNYREEKTE